MASEGTPGVRRTGVDEWAVTPAHIGNTWEKDPDWDGPRSPEGFILPKWTLGWQILKWVRENCLDDEGGVFRPTKEQSRFILWWYAIDEAGRFVHRKGVFQRLKGHGKDPLAAILCAVEFVGPCRFSGWATKDMPDLAVAAGEPVGKEHPRAWIQIAAVNLAQTGNTMTIFGGLFTEECKTKHGIDIGKEVIYAYAGNRRIQAVTSSPRALEGGRPTFIVQNETHHWRENNEGWAMAAVNRRNLAKAKGGMARALSITNAYEPSEDSVGQQERENYEAEQSENVFSTGVYYDSLEAPPDARLRPPKENKDDPEPNFEQITAYIGAILRAVRGDATWLDVETITLEILDRNNPASQSRRFYYNQVLAAEDAWVDPLAVDSSIAKIIAERRHTAGDPTRLGWDPVSPEDKVVMFFDGSKSDDSTGIVGCRLDDGYVFTIGVWQRPRGSRGEGWLAPRSAVDERVREAFSRFNVVGFWADPSHAQDDVDSTSYWVPVIDEWHATFKERLEAWPLKSGNRTHSILFDMANPENQRHFAPAAMMFVDEMERLNDVEEYDPVFQIDGHPALVAHLKNAKRNIAGKYGVTPMKENRESLRKIDLAVCAVGARMLRRIVLNSEKPPEDEFPDGAPLWF